MKIKNLLNNPLRLISRHIDKNKINSDSHNNIHDYYVTNVILYIAEFLHEVNPLQQNRILSMLKKKISYRIPPSRQDNQLYLLIFYPRLTVPLRIQQQ